MESSQANKTFDVKEDCSRQIALMSDNSRQTDKQTDRQKYCLNNKYSYCPVATQLNCYPSEFFEKHLRQMIIEVRKIKS